MGREQGRSRSTTPPSCVSLQWLPSGLVEWQLSCLEDHSKRAAACSRYQQGGMITTADKQRATSPSADGWLFTARQYPGGIVHEAGRCNDLSRPDRGAMYPGPR
jgi:hypothetical protein